MGHPQSRRPRTPGTPPTRRAGAPPRAGARQSPRRAGPPDARYDCDHAGLYLLLPAIAELGLDTLIGAARYPGTKTLSSFHSLASLLLLKASRRGRAANAFPLGADAGLGLALGLVAIPKATHLTSYSYRVRRSSNVALLEGLAKRCRQVGLYTGEGGFNLDFHTIRHHGDEVPLEEHYVASRSQRTRSVLTFFAQDHASTEMVYANADITKAEQAREVIAFADYWSRVAGTDPGLLCFDSKLTTYPMLSELCARAHHLPHAAPTRPQSPRSPRRPARLGLDHLHRQTVRPLPPPPDPRTRSSTSKASATPSARSRSATSATTSRPC